jgi:hypothetical protein
MFTGYKAAADIPELHPTNLSGPLLIWRDLASEGRGDLWTRKPVCGIVELFSMR